MEGDRIMKKFLFSAIALLIPVFAFVGNVSAGSNDSNITYQRIPGAYFYLKNNIAVYIIAFQITH